MPKLAWVVFNLYFMMENTQDEPSTDAPCSESLTPVLQLNGNELINIKVEPETNDNCGLHLKSASDFEGPSLALAEEPQAYSLKNHTTVHTKKTSYICDNCGKSFSQESLLETHKFVHTGDKPYSSDIFDECFPQVSSLMTQMLLHTGQKPYTCDTRVICFIITQPSIYGVIVYFLLRHESLNYSTGQ